ncbi:MAG: FecR domain-containing protein [Betaproteobacteria bacterium]|nr:FecR domain-containing protein [Betaproteobacteria bacterium]
MKQATRYLKPGWNAAWNIAAVLLLMLAAGSAIAQEVGHFQFLSGDVRVLRAGQTLQATRNFSLQQGDTVETGSDGQAQMRMVDAVFIALRPRSHLTIDSYRNKPNGAEAGVLSLSNGILRTFTSALSAGDRNKFRMKARNATLGIRGSGNILAATDMDGVINHTLTGAHSVTSTDTAGHERTLISYPGQTVQVLPGAQPRFIPTPPFILSAATATAAKADTKGDAKSDSKSDAKADAAPAQSADAGGSATAPATSTAAAAAAAVSTATIVAPPVSAATTSTVVTTLASAQFPLDRPAGFLSRFMTPFASSGFVGAFPQGVVPGAELTFNGSGALTRANHVTFATYLAGPGAQPTTFTPINIADARVDYSGGTAADVVRNREGSIAMGRWEGGNVVVTDLSNSAATTYSLASRSAVWSVLNATGSGFVASLTGATNYALETAVRPTDAFGNVGQLVAASASLNFSTLVWNASVQVAINNQNLTSSVSNQPLTVATSNFGSQTTISCTGTNCNTLGYRGIINGNLAGATGSSLLMDYRISPNRVPGNAFTDTIWGAAALSAVSTPTIGIVLPQTGSLTLPFSSYTLVEIDQRPPTFGGSLSANFSNKTVDMSLTVVSNDPTTTQPERHQFNANGMAIHGVGFSAHNGSAYARPGDGIYTHSCTNCNNSDLQGRFDGYFTNSQGTGATVNFALVETVPQPDGNNTHNGTIYFGTAPRNLLASAPTSAAGALSASAARLGAYANQLTRWDGGGRARPNLP